MMQGFIPLLLCALAALLGSCGGGGSSPVPPNPPATAATAFNGNIVLGSPTTTSIRLKLYSPDQSGTVWLSYGTTPGNYSKQSAPASLLAGQVLDLSLDALSADSAYSYQLNFQFAGTSQASVSGPYSFHTARPGGASFSFTIQADSHLDENSSLPLYRNTLSNILADAPDFHIDLGDTFMTEKHSAPLTALVQMAPDAAP